jgi:hypothetical protein
MTFDPPLVLPELRHIPVNSAARWEARLKATRAPHYIPVTTYTLKLTLNAEQPFLLVWINRSRRRIEYAKTWRHDAAVELEIELLYFEDWELAQQVTVGLGQVGAGLDGPVSLQTGVLYDWAIDPVFHYDRKQMLLIALSDTENIRGRWRLKPAFRETLPAWLGFLSTGRCSGSAPQA